MDKEKFWGALVNALDAEKMDPTFVGRIVTLVLRALDYAEEAEE